MTLIKDIYDFIDKIAPFETAFSYDNCGLLVGSYESTVNKALLSLDITKDVVKEAQKIGANLIISHHPIIFKPIKNINFESTLHLLCKFGINAICAHTNLDIAKNGVNYYLAKALNLQNRTFAIIENGSWACRSGNLMREFLEGMRDMTVLDDKVTLVSSLKEDNITDMDILVDSVMESMK